MRFVGLLFTGAVGVLAAGAVALGVRSVPDVKRYLKMRSM